MTQGTPILVTQHKKKQKNKRKKKKLRYKSLETVSHLCFIKKKERRKGGRERAREGERKREIKETDRKFSGFVMKHTSSIKGRIMYGFIKSYSNVSLIRILRVDLKISLNSDYHNRYITLCYNKMS